MNIMMKQKINDMLFIQLKKMILRKKDPPQSLRTQYQVQNETQIRRNQEVIKNNNDELTANNYHKKNNQLFKNKSLNHQGVPHVKEIIG